MTGRTALITIAHGRHEHWRRQREAVQRSRVAPDDHLLVAIADPILAAEGADDEGVHVVDIPAAPSGLPLAAARNRGAEAAIIRGADTLIFLDVDCLPGVDLIGAYDTTLARIAGILAGPVTYLPPPPPAGYDVRRLADLDAPHPGRPAPAPGETQSAADPRLFWSLSFAVTAQTWRRIGGFHEAYVGYGGEDTDFGVSAASRGIPLTWVGDARAYHQHHRVESPPVSHLDAILRNGALFARRWGWWPMTGWLDAFVASGYVRRTPDGGYARVDPSRD